MEVVFEELLVEVDVVEFEEEVLEIVEVPEDGLAVEGRARIGDGEVKVGAGLLDGGEVGESLTVEGEHLGVESPTLPALVEQEAVERLVAEVLLEVAHAVVADGVDLWHGNPFRQEMARVGQEGVVLAEVVADGAYAAVGGRREAVVAAVGTTTPQGEAIAACLASPLLEEPLQLLHYSSPGCSSALRAASAAARASASCC